MRGLRPGEIRIEGLGKRYWFRSHTKNVDDWTDNNADPEDEEEDEEDTFFRGRRTEIWALKDINCHIQPGDRIAVVGNNGAGKSTLIRILSRTLPPSEGLVEGAGIVIPFASLKSPLNVRMSGVENLKMMARLLAIPAHRVDERLPEIIEFSGIGVLAYERVTRYSQSSFIRLSMAMGLLVDANIYLVDDDLKSGDDNYRAKFQAAFADRIENGATLIYATNKLPQMRSTCRRALWLEQGHLIEDGNVDDIAAHFIPNEVAPDDQRVNEGSEPQLMSPAPQRDLGPVDLSASRLRPMKNWLREVADAERSWKQFVDGWRTKVRGQETEASRFVEGRGRNSLGTIRGLRCLNSAGSPIEQCLPGENLRVELLLETFKPELTVSVRLELFTKSETFIFQSEPLVPLLTEDPGQYLFRADVEGNWLAHTYENLTHKFIARVLFSHSDGEQWISNAIARLVVRGEMRVEFEEQRKSEGGPATSLLNPMPMPGRQFAEQEGNDPTSEEETATRTKSRRPGLRPRLNWIAYRVAGESAASDPRGEGAKDPLPHEAS